MEKLWPLKGKILTGKKRVLFNGAVYLPEEERGNQVLVQLDPEVVAKNTATTSAPTLLLEVPDLCFGFLEYNVKTSKGYASKEDSEVRHALLDLYREHLRIKKFLPKQRKKVKSAKQALVERRRDLSKAYTRRIQLDKRTHAAYQRVIDEAECELDAEIVLLEEAEAQWPFAFETSDALRAFFKQKLDFPVANITLERYARNGVPLGRKNHPGHGPGPDLSRAAERDFAALIRYAKDSGAPLRNVQIVVLATKVRDMERQAKRTKSGKPLPVKTPFDNSWMKGFRNRMRVQGIPLESTAESQEWAIDNEGGDSSATASINLRGANTRSNSSNSGGSSAALASTTVALMSAVVDMARGNEERKLEVSILCEEQVTELREENEEEMKQVQDEIKEFEEQAAELLRQAAEGKLLFEKLQSKAKQKENKIRKTMLPVSTNLDVEKTVLNRVYNALTNNPTDEVCHRIAAQVDTFANADRDEYGAIVAPFVGPFVSRRPVLETTNEEARRILSEALDVTGAGNSAALVGVKRRRTDTA